MRKTKIGIIGLHQSGKSLLINCLLKRFVSKVGTGSATTHTAVSYSFSDDEYAECLDPDGWHTIEISDVIKYDNNDSIYKINVYLNNSLLKAFTLVDLPGTGYNTKDNTTMALALKELDFAILLATDVKELSNSSSFYANTLQLLQRYNLPYYFILNCTNITKWSPNNKQNVEVAKSDLDLLQIYEPLSLGEVDEYPLVNLIWYWCSIADDDDEIFLKYLDSIRNHFERIGKSWDRHNLEVESNFRLVRSIFEKGNRAYIELTRDFRKELIRLKDELCPIGTIQAFAFESIPQGWLLCNGQALKKEEYPELYSVIGVTFGEKGKTKFKIPDLRSKFVRGWDERNRKFGSDQEDALQGHSHVFHLDIIKMELDGQHDHDLYWGKFNVRDPSINSANNHEQLIPVPYANRQESRYGRIGSDFWTKDGSVIEGKHSHKILIDGDKELIGNPIDSNYSSMNNKVDTETRPKNIALSYCIKVKH